MTTRKYRLVGADGQVTWSTTPGLLGGNRQSCIYGRLDCPAARRALDRGGYVHVRVFFADEATAIAAGFRPCAVCMPDEYRRWKAQATGDQPARVTVRTQDGVREAIGQSSEARYNLHQSGARSPDCDI